MKAMKFVFKLVLWVVGVLVVVALALPLWVGPVAKTVANAVVPGKTGTAFSLGRFALNPYSGHVSVGDVRLCNPEGFLPAEAVVLDKLDVDVDTASLAGDVIVVRDIDLSGLFVSYVANKKMENNFMVIRKHAQGARQEETPVERMEPGTGTPGAKDSAGKSQGGGERSSDRKPAKKVIIDHLKISGVKVQLGPLPFPLPTIELRDIGRKTRGVTLKEAWDQVYGQVMQSSGALRSTLGSLGGKIDVQQVNAVLDAVNSVDRKGRLNKTINAAMGVLSQGGGKTVETVGQGTGKAVQSVGEGTGKAAKKVGEGAEKTVDAVGEGAEKAVNALKGFFK